VTHLALGEQQDHGTALRSQMAWSLEFRPPFGPYGGEQPLLEQAGCRAAVRLEVGGADHQPILLACPTREPGEDAAEDAHAAPANKVGTSINPGLRRVLMARMEGGAAVRERRATCFLQADRDVTAPRFLAPSLKRAWRGC